jgi:hypothetical protein
MFAKRFFFACAGILCLALAYHFGATGATAQVVAGNPVVGGFLTTNNVDVVTANGDIYQSAYTADGPWAHIGNVFAGTPTAAVRESWGSLKARYHR